MTNFSTIIVNYVLRQFTFPKTFLIISRSRQKKWQKIKVWAFKVPFFTLIFI